MVQLDLLESGGRLNFSLIVALQAPGGRPGSVPVVLKYQCVFCAVALLCTYCKDPGPDRAVCFPCTHSTLGMGQPQLAEGPALLFSLKKQFSDRGSLGPRAVIQWPGVQALSEGLAVLPGGAGPSAWDL